VAAVGAEAGGGAVHKGAVGGRGQAAVEGAVLLD
jgi:hypothetical protein